MTHEDGDGDGYGDRDGDGYGKIKLLNKLYYLIPPYTYRSKPSDISDTGASGHYLKADAPHDIEICPVAPIKVKQLNRKIL